MKGLCVIIAALISAPAAALPVANFMVEASAHHRRGVLHFELGQYKDALAEFEEAYQLSPQPLLLFNIAQSQRLSGQREQALATYQMFLQAVPDAPNRDDVERFVSELSGPTETVLLAPPQAKPRRPLVKRWWLWTSVAAVVVGVVVTGAVVGTAHGSSSDRMASLGVWDARR